MGGGWTALHLPVLTSLAACARDASARAEPLTLLTAVEGRTLGAFADRILPPDPGLPGAVDAGAVHFVDRALAELMPPVAPVVREGLAELDRRSGGDFAGLDATRQDEVMRALEDSEFFYVGRMLVLCGVFADPKYGGNRDGAGNELVGIEPHGAHSPPFGWYDAQYAAESGGAA